jgi:hypothetical protein
MIFATRPAWAFKKNGETANFIDEIFLDCMETGDEGTELILSSENKQKAYADWIFKNVKGRDVAFDLVEEMDMWIADAIEQGYEVKYNFC